jgi:hypothetical protein
MSIYERGAHRIPRLIAQLDNPEPARLHPRPGRAMDRRSRLEVALSASMLTLRKGRLRGLAKALEDE